MFMITNVIELCMGKVIPNHLIRNNYPESRNGLLDVYIFKLTLGSDYWYFVSGQSLSKLS